MYMVWATIRHGSISKATEYKTLPTFFSTLELDNKTNTDNETTNPAEVPDGETEDSQEESPDQKQKESEEVPETIFQG